MEPRFELTALRTNDRPGLEIMWATQGVSRAILLAASLMFPASVLAQTAGAPLVLQTKIALGEVSGRIDHLSIDTKSIITGSIPITLH